MEIFGKQYYIDLDAMSERCQYVEHVPKTDDEGNTLEGQEEVIQINVFKYEIIKLCVQRILGDADEPEDDTLGRLNENKKEVSFKFAFNTLLQNGIIKTFNDGKEF